jgi:hypothetical protein
MPSMVSLAPYSRLKWTHKIFFEWERLRSAGFELDLVRSELEAGTVESRRLLESLSSRV